MSDARSLESYFIDWEGEAFGFGYGSGEPHTIPVLRDFFAKVPAEGGYDYRELEAQVGPVVAWLLINRLAHHDVDVIEYGSSPRFAWLTPNGCRLRDFVLSKTADELVDLVTTSDQEQPRCGPDCCNCGPHGYDAARKCPNPFWRERR